MNKIKFHFILFLSLYLNTACVVRNDNNNTAKFSGVWEDAEIPRLINIGDFSWGKNPYSTGSVIIDLGAKRPYISAQGGIFIITSIKYSVNDVILIGYFKFDKKIFFGHIILGASEFCVAGV